MEQNLQLQTEPVPKSVRVRQNIAAWLFVITNSYWILNIFIGNIFSFIIPYDTLAAAVIESIALMLIYIVGYSILATIASNKAIKIATILGITTIFTSTAYTFFTTIHLYYVWATIKSIIWIYVFSTILKANSIDTSDKRWINILIINYIIGAICAINIIILTHYSLDLQNPNYDMLQHSFGLYYNPTYFKIWELIWYCLVLIAEYRFAKCKAFSGNYDSSPAPKATYSPLNKYFIATLITIIITSGLWIAIYSNIVAIENF